MTDKIAWPQSLKSSHALGELAEDIYDARRNFYGLHDAPAWDELDHHARIGFIDVARRLLTQMQPESAQADALFAYGTALARVVGTIGPRE